MKSSTPVCAKVLFQSSVKTPGHTSPRPCLDIQHTPIMLRRASSVVGRAAVRARGVHTEAKLKEMGIELPTPKPPLGEYLAPNMS